MSICFVRLDYAYRATIPIYITCLNLEAKLCQVYNIYKLQKISGVAGNGGFSMSRGGNLPPEKSYAFPVLYRRKFA